MFRLSNKQIKNEKMELSEVVLEDFDQTKLSALVNDVCVTVIQAAKSTLGRFYNIYKKIQKGSW